MIHDAEDARASDAHNDTDPDQQQDQQQDNQSINIATLDDLLDWAAQVIGSPITHTDRSASQQSALVLELTNEDGGRWFLKYPRDPKRFEREVHAYETILPPMGDLVPRLISSNAEHRTLLISAVDGEPANLRPLTVDPRVHRAAGKWLARLHASATPTPSASASASTSLADQFVEQQQTLISKLGDLLNRREIGLLKRATTGVTAPTDDVVPCHGDFTPRNWLVDELEVVRVIDFSGCDVGLALRDFVRLAHRVWIARPNLEKAFFDGYGRRLDDVEQRTLDAYVAVSIVSSMLRAFNRSDREALKRQRRLLGRIDDSPTRR